MLHDDPSSCLARLGWGKHQAKCFVVIPASDRGRVAPPRASCASVRANEAATWSGLKSTATLKLARAARPLFQFLTCAHDRLLNRSEIRSGLQSAAVALPEPANAARFVARQNSKRCAVAGTGGYFREIWFIGEALPGNEIAADIPIIEIQFDGGQVLC